MSKGTFSTFADISMKSVHYGFNRNGKHVFECELYKVF